MPGFAHPPAGENAREKNQIFRAKARKTNKQTNKQTKHQHPPQKHINTTKKDEKNTISPFFSPRLRAKLNLSRQKKSPTPIPPRGE